MEAVISCFDQGLNDFEIILVDDGSNDGTKKIIESIMLNHSNVLASCHSKNKGGGATRNTAVSMSSSDFIFCLDSDDILPERTLCKLLTFAKETKCHGALFEETRFFSGSVTSKTESVFNKITKRSITLPDIFETENGFLTRVNFLYTRETYNVAEGYPEHHGYDTQTFGLKCLEKKLDIRVCPNTYYLHRRTKKSSYFTREYNEGKLSFNAYLMYEDIFHLFSKKVQDEIMRYDIFSRFSLGRDNLEKTLQELFTRIGSDAFFAKFHTNNPFIDGIASYKAGRFSESFLFFKESALSYPEAKIPWFNMLRASVMQSTSVLTSPPEVVLFDIFKQPSLSTPWKRRLFNFLKKKFYEQR